MHAFITWIQGVATSLGGPGIFAIAVLDSSFVSLPQINDLLLVVMVTRYKSWMPYYAALATLGSITGCYILYSLAARGGQAFLSKRVAGANLTRTLALYRKHGLLALMIPALLPPPAPFKLFVLAAGLAEVRPLPFVAAIAIARGIRYVALGFLAIYYGDVALELMRTRGRLVALCVVGVILLAIGGWWIWNRRQHAGATA